MDFKPKLMVFDLDGTLAESKQRVEPGIGDLLGRLLEVIPVAIMSGAGFSQFEKQLLPVISIDSKLTHLYLFPDNAAQCYTYASGKWHPQYDQSFTTDESFHILEALRAALKETGLDEVPVRVWGERVEDRGSQITFSGLGQRAPLDEKAKWDPTGEKRELLRKALSTRLPEFSEATGGMTSVDITRKGITKAFGIRKLVDLAHVNIEDMLYVGDALQEGGNDNVVVETGVRTHAVIGPGETARLIEDVIEQYAEPAPKT